MTISYLRGVSPAGQYLELPDPEPSQVDRGPPTHREDLPLPTEPPFTAFVGNLAFDLTDVDLEEFFAGHQVREASCPCIRRTQHSRTTLDEVHKDYKR